MALTGSPQPPVVVSRRRIDLADPQISGSQQPYHTAQGLDPTEAEQLVVRCADGARLLATRVLRTVIDELQGSGHAIVGSGILLASGRPPRTIAEGLASHPSMHAAEGNLFRDALIRANEACNVPVVAVKERELYARAATELGIPPEELRRVAGELGRPLGPPWRQDEKLAALVGWMALTARP